jgi:hypothetical protein
MANPTIAAVDTFARLLATGVAETEAYTKSGIGSVLACSVSQAVRHPDVVARVAQLKSSGVTTTSAPAAEAEPRIDPRKVDKQTVLSMLIRDRELARATGQASAAVRASELIGKELSMFIDRKQIDLSILDKMDLDEQRALLAAIDDLAGVSGGTGGGTKKPN